jgi:hypothetical protein
MAAKSIKPSEFDPKKLVFKTCVWKPLGSGEFGRVMIEYKTKEGTGPLLVTPSKPIYNYGIQDNVNDKTKEINGYSVGLCIAMDEKEPEIKALEKMMISLHEEAKLYILANKGDCRQDELNDIKDLTSKVFTPPIFIPRDKVTRALKPDRRKIYAKLIWYAKNEKSPEKMLTILEKLKGFSPEGKAQREDIPNPLTVRQPNKMLPTLHLHSLYIGTKISLQTKLFRGVVIPVPGGNTPEVNQAQLDELADELKDAFSGLSIDDSAPAKSESGKDSPKGKAKEESKSSGKASDVAAEL